MLSEELKLIIGALETQGKMAFLEATTEEKIADFIFDDSGNVVIQAWVSLDKSAIKKITFSEKRKNRQSYNDNVVIFLLY